MNKPISRIGIVLVFGISGVGKSTACASYVARHPSVLHTSAGALLQAAKNIDSAILRTDVAGNILQNQNLLGEALKHFRWGRETSDVLIDAHSVIDNDHELIEVPTDAVRAMSPNGLVLLEAPPELVAERRRKDARLRPSRTPEELQFQTGVARRVCESYASELGLPLEIGTAMHDDDLEMLIQRMISRRRIG
ncbi:ATP-binding protein [Bradyrhizobium elkanii]|uniref:ATP-binding protein n=1 Tax=Bradyrhizobium elkanii TaxID=29448 RepID=UPI002169EC5D|nr:ATP-binding protein [Bradyrhizobium elkanii]WLB11289.1 ATP-binding protein [Bradyrhizobium elkanii]